MHSVAHLMGVHLGACEVKVVVDGAAVQHTLLDKLHVVLFHAIELAAEQPPPEAPGCQAERRRGEGKKRDQPRRAREQPVLEAVCVVLPGGSAVSLSLSVAAEVSEGSRRAFLRRKAGAGDTT